MTRPSPMPSRAGLALALPLALAAGHALAQERPAHLTPTHDAALVYSVQTDGQPAQQVSVAWLAAGPKLRIDTPGQPGWMLFDIAGKRALMVMDAQKMAMRLPGAGSLPMLGQIPENAHVTREGMDRVAGLACQVWRISGPEGEGTTCLTADGMMLRAEGVHKGRKALLLAQNVSTAPQPLARFEVPAGYQTVTMPGR